MGSRGAVCGRAPVLGLADHAEAAGPVDRVDADPVADSPAGDAGADGGYCAGFISAVRVWQWQLLSVQYIATSEIYMVERGRFEFDQHFAGAGLGGGQVAVFECVQVTVGAEENGFHGGAIILPGG